MAGALVGALAPTLISTLSAPGTAGQPSPMSGLVQTASKTGTGIMSGIGTFVSDLLHGKGFKESLASGVDTMIGRNQPQGYSGQIPQSTVLGSSQGATYGQIGGMPMMSSLLQGGQAASGISGGSMYGGVERASRSSGSSGRGLGSMDISIKTTRMHPTTGVRYVTAVIPMPTFKQMVMLYMGQAGYDQNAIATVANEIESHSNEMAQASPQGGMSARLGPQQYGYPILSSPSYSSRSAPFMYQKYGDVPPLEGAGPSKTPVSQLPSPAGGIVTSGGIATPVPK